MFLIFEGSRVQGFKGSSEKLNKSLGTLDPYTTGTLFLFYHSAP